MMRNSNIIRFIILSGIASLPACKTTQPPAPVVEPIPAQVYEPEPAAQPTPQPEYVEPDQRWLPGHSSYTTPVPVDPVEVDEMEPVITE